jgi:serine/threonine protein kinase
LKKISKRYTNMNNFKTETDALLRIYDNGGHPNISGLRDMYEDHTHFYLILDLVSGGEMFEHLINYGAYSEADAARLMHEVASALAFLHGVGVVHADLKPENLLLCSKNRFDGTIKIIDFGCAVVEETEEGNKTRAKKLKEGAVSTGTTAYWPPERFRKGSIPDGPADMWSVGVILYIMLTGVHPFDVEGVSTDDQIEKRIKNARSPPLDPKYTSHLSESALDLIKRLMEVNPRKRMTAYEMLHHPWVMGETATTEKMEDSDKKLSRFKELRDKLEAGVFAVLVKGGQKDFTMSEKKNRPL